MEMETKNESNPNRIIALSMPPTFFEYMKYSNRSEEIKMKVLKLLREFPWIAELYKQKAVMSTISVNKEVKKLLDPFGKFRSEIIRLSIILDELLKGKSNANV